MNRKFFAIILSFVMCFAVAGLCVAGCASKADEKTAYQLWLEKNPSGTMDEFYAWLEGNDGEDGKDGKDGQDGRGIVSAVVEGNKIVITYTDNTKSELEIPAQSVDAVTSVEVKDGKIVVNYSNGTSSEFVVPAGRCEECNFGEFVEIADHKLDAKGEVVNGKAIRVCEDCGFAVITSDYTVVHEYEKHSYAATCTEPAYEAEVCKVCGLEKDKVEVGEALDHDWKTYIVIDLDKNICEEGGLYYEVCNRCGETRERSTDGPIGHNVKAWNVTPKPSATAVGAANGFCSVCGKNVSIELPKLSADNYSIAQKVEGECANKKTTSTYTMYVNVEGKEASKDFFVGSVKVEFAIEVITHHHTLNGNVMSEAKYPASTAGITEVAGQNAACKDEKTGLGVYTCDVCNLPVTVITYVPHTYNSTDVVVTEKPDCDTAGKGTVLCSVCKVQVEVDVPATDHEFSVRRAGEKLILECTVEDCGYSVSYTIVGEPTVVDSTCSEKGSITFTYVDGNGAHHTATIENALARHSLNGSIALYDRYPAGTPGITEVAGQNAACKDNKTGLGIYMCSACNLPVTVVTYVDHVWESEPTKKDATCTENGLLTGKCKTCNAEVNDVIPATRHSLKLIVIEEPTATEGGKANLVCTTCSYEEDGTVTPLMINVVLPNLLDGYSNGVYVGKLEDNHRVSEKTCSTDGIIRHTAVMGKVIAGFEYQLNEGDEEIEESVVITADATDHIIVEINEGRLAHYLNGKAMGATTSVLTAGVTEVAGQYSDCTTGANGLGIYTCDNCKLPVTIETLPEHSWIGEAKVTVEPTCTTTGTKVGKCAKCGDVSQSILALGHSLKFVIDTEPTLTVAGVAHFECTRCFELDADGEPLTDANGNKIAKVLVPNLSLPALNTEDAYDKVEVSAPTCSAAGLTVYYGEYTYKYTGTEIEYEEVTYKFQVEVETGKKGHVAPTDPELFIEWTANEVEKLAILDKNGVAVKDAEGNATYMEVEVYHEYTGYICAECGTMRITADTMYINGHKISKLEVRVFEEYLDADGNIVASNVEGAKLYKISVLTCIDETEECIEASHMVIIAKEEIVIG